MLSGMRLKLNFFYAAPALGFFYRSRGVFVFVLERRFYESPEQIPVGGKKLIKKLGLYDRVAGAGLDIAEFYSRCLSLSTEISVWSVIFILLDLIYLSYRDLSFQSLDFWILEKQSPLETSFLALRDWRISE